MTFAHVRQWCFNAPRCCAAQRRTILHLPCKACHDQKRKHRVEELITEAKLEHAALTPARLLSGGEQQRLAIARARASEPELLFLDEPAASLDPIATHAVEDFVRDIHHDGIKVILVTHDVGQAKRLADDVLFLHRGRVIEQAPAEEFFKRPTSAAARAYLDGQLAI